MLGLVFVGFLGFRWWHHGLEVEGVHFFKLFLQCLHDESVLFEEAESHELFGLDDDIEHVVVL